MRVLILGEGDNDLGKRTPDGTLTQKGALPVLVERLMGAAVTQILVREWKTVRTFPKGRRAKGHGAKLEAAAALSEGRESDAIVGVVDRDGLKNEGRRAELSRGKQTLEEHGKPCAVGLAVEMIEAWLLADEKALQQALNDRSVNCQPDPERLDSRDEASDRHPKTRLHGLIDRYANDPSVGYTRHYAAIAQHSDLAVIERRCPAGFKPFAAQVRTLVGG